MFQVKHYNEWIKAEKLQGIVTVSPKKNKKGANVGFGIAPKLTDATMRFDDREGKLHVIHFKILEWRS